MFAIDLPYRLEIARYYEHGAIDIVLQLAIAIVWWPMVLFGQIV